MADIEVSPTLQAIIDAVKRGEGWFGYCTDCDTGSGPLATRAEAEVWPTLHRVVSPTCRPPQSVEQESS